MGSQENSIPQTNEEMKNSPPKNKQMEICPKSRTGNKNICRRFSDEQIQSLESIFKREAKLEPAKKVQLARDIGLQPRQVAIWFQNKRARWKSKQIEQEYRDLRANYDSLSGQFDGLKRENQSLLIQLEELNELVRNLDRVDLAKKYGKLEKYPNIGSNEKMDRDDIEKAYDEDNDKTPAKYSEKTDDREILSWSEGDELLSHLASPDKWCDFSSSGFFDQSAGVSSWWED